MKYSPAELKDFLMGLANGNAALSSDQGNKLAYVITLLNNLPPFPEGFEIIQFTAKLKEKQI